MPVMSEFQEERDSVKKRPFKDRVAYFWDYYKWYVIGGVFGVFFLGSLLKTVIFHKDVVLNVAWLNFSPYDESEELVYTPLLEHLTELGLNPKKEDIVMDSTLTVSTIDLNQETILGSQKLGVIVAAKDLDAVVSAQTSFSTYAYQNFYLPLDQYLSAEEIAALDEQGLIYYADEAYIEELGKDTDGKLSWDANFYKALPDHSDPDSMEKPVAVGICVDGSKVLPSAFYSRIENEPIFAAVVFNSQNPEYAKEFVTWLLEN